ncbi:MAG TPA: hypothetical protein VJS88_08405, partial [Chthoniobacterales bacterium]|nr:hypothetical protein [Chthoniobacterales bacterium]
MRRIICIALFGLLVSSEAAFSQHRQWVRPHGRVFVHAPRFGSHPGFHHHHHYFDPFRYFVQDFTASYVAPVPIVPFAATYFFLPSASTSRP